MKKLAAVLALAFGVVSGAFAAVDTTAVTAYIAGELTTNVVAVALAMLLVVFTVKGIKMLRRA
ncbi:MAG: hypothetical protein C4555_00515 [Dehalococcoidia bacterium]|nr:MAG: hypothetical protein C4555_00515 [Dehalococcoidia bacterium]